MQSKICGAPDFSTLIKRGGYLGMCMVTASNLPLFQLKRNLCRFSEESLKPDGCSKGEQSNYFQVPQERPYSQLNTSQEPRRNLPPPNPGCC